MAFSILLASCTNPKPPEEKRSEAPTPVASVAGSAGVNFGLVPGSCSDGKCRAVIQLIRDNRMLDSAPLEFAASEAQLRKAEGDTGITSREPLEVWTAGKENGSVTTALRVVKLTPEQSGLLVYQVGGFEHIKRRYDLFAEEAGKLKRVWSAAEKQGPAWSSADVAETAAGDEIIYLEGLRGTGKDPDQFEAKRLGWDAASKSLTERPKLALPVVVAGKNFPTADAARKAAAGTCLSEYWVLPAITLGAKTSSFMLAMVTANKQSAEAEQARECKTKLVRSVAVFRP
jgi:hypothetical protein